MVTWPKASSTPSFAIMRLARAIRSRASSSLFGTGVLPTWFLVMPGLVPGIHVFLQMQHVKDVDGRDKPGHDDLMGHRVYRPGDQPAGASSKPSNVKPGATVQPVSVQSPRLSAACQARAGTVTCGTSPAARSAPSRMISSVAPSTNDSLSGARPRN